LEISALKVETAKISVAFRLEDFTIFGFQFTFITLNVKNGFSLLDAVGFLTFF
jgi:hypothetical protein